MPEGPKVGVDVVDVDRFARAIRRRPRLLARVFTEGELMCLRSRNADERLAARFAAKEAVFKAAGAGWPQLGYRDVEVVTGADGSPCLRLGGKVADALAGRAVAVSMSHAGGVAVASVVTTASGAGEKP